MYRKAIECVLYPVSLMKPHNFRPFSPRTPAFCEECDGYLSPIGLTAASSAIRCEDCHAKCHEKYVL